MLMLLFYCGPYCFALDSAYVLEIFPRVHLTAVPQAPAPILGLLNYGGVPVPVIDFCQFVEKRASHSCLHTRLILLQVDAHLIALLAEKVTETAEIDHERFIASGLKIETLPFFKGVYSEQGKAIQWFDVPTFCDFLQSQALLRLG